MEVAGFCGGSYEVQSRSVDTEKTVNLYWEPSQSEGATTKGALYQRPGVMVLDEADSGVGRAHTYVNGQEWAVVDRTLYEITAGGNFVAKGGAVTLAIDDNPATISSNGDGGGQLFITSGTNGYCYDILTDTLTQVAAINGKAAMGDMLDGYFIALDPTTSTFYISDLLDGLTWDPTQFAQRSAAPDRWRAMRVFSKYIWLLGEQTSEVWYDAGTFPFPMAPTPSGIVPFGTAAPFSTAVSSDAITWLGTDKQGSGYVLRAEGFSPENVADFAFQAAVNTYNRVSDAQGDTFTYQGHTFFRLDFVSQNLTWYYDVSTKKWGMFDTWIDETSTSDSWHPRWHAFAFGQHRILDSRSATLYHMSADYMTDVLDDDGDPREIRRVRRAQGPFSEDQRIGVAYFQLDLQMGLGLETGQGEDPEVMLKVSKDGGNVWGNEDWVSAGRIGEYGARAKWCRLGQGRRWVFEVAMTDPVPMRIANAYVRLAKRSEAA